MSSMRANAAKIAHPEDIGLALACAAGDAGALAAFERDVLPLALRATAGIVGPSQQEIAQALRMRIFMHEPGTAPRIAGYRGEVSLIAWTRVVARRCALNLKSASPPESEDLDAHLFHIAASGTPETDVANERFRVNFRGAFAEAVKTLPQRERAVLRLHVVDGLSLEKVAASYGVHRATIARWVATARATVLERTRDALARTLGPSQSGLDSLLRGALSNLDVSISGAFAAERTEL